MSALDMIVQKYRGLDEVDRGKVRVAVVFIILFIILIYTMSNTADTLGGILGGGAQYVNNSVGNLDKVVPTKAT